jgi:chromosome segregation ATPase
VDLPDLESGPDVGRVLTNLESVNFIGLHRNFLRVDCHSMSRDEIPAVPEPRVDFRQKQMQELERLQVALDENSRLRGKYNALQAQVAPLVDAFAATQMPTYQSERVYTPEEIEVLKTRLEQTLSDYREETRIASRLNSEIEKRYTELSTMRMKSQLDQDERLTHQNHIAALGLANFRVKSVKITETADIERQRLLKAVENLRQIQELSAADLNEFHSQNSSNQRGIEELAASIASAKEDIRDFTERLQKLEPKLEQYAQLKAEHQKSEEQVVRLSDDYDTIRKKVDTESLTANIRRQIDSGNQTIADLNRQVDHILNRGSIVQEKIRTAKLRIADLHSRIKRTKAETAKFEGVRAGLVAEKAGVQRDLRQCRQAEENLGGENEIVYNEICDGVQIVKAPWQIRTQLLTLKQDVRELSGIEREQARFEAALSGAGHAESVVPQRKRLRLIPLTNRWP